MDVQQLVATAEVVGSNEKPSPSQQSRPASSLRKQNEAAESPPQSLEIPVPYIGSLKLSGFPLWANLSVLGTLVLIVVALFLSPLFRKPKNVVGERGGEFNVLLLVLIPSMFLVGWFSHEALNSLLSNLKNRAPMNGNSASPLGRKDPQARPLNKAPSSNGNRNDSLATDKIFFSPLPPKVLLASPSKTNESIDLSWTDTSSNEDGFRIERKRRGDSREEAFEEIAVLREGSEAFNDLTIKNGQSYTYRVRSFRSDLSSPPSPLASATAPEIPSRGKVQVPNSLNDEIVLPAVTSMILGGITALLVTSIVLKQFSSRPDSRQQRE